MAAIGNFLWILMAGWAVALAWLLAAAIAVVSVVLAPLAPSALKLALFSLFPFGRELIDKQVLYGNSTTAVKTLRSGLNVIWLVLVGWWLATFLSLFAVGFFITIIGIPFGVQALKLAGAALWPVGKEIVSKELAREAKQQSAKEALNLRRAKATAVVPH